MPRLGKFVHRAAPALRVACLVPALCLSGWAVTVYQNNFQGPAGSTYPEWSGGEYSYTANNAGTVSSGGGRQAITNVESANGRERFLGEFGGPAVVTARPFDARHFVRMDQSVRLTLGDLARHSSATVSFDLYVLKSWDGNNPNYGPDRWRLSVPGGPTLLDTSFSNNFKTGSFDLSLQDYPHAGSAPQAGAAAVKTLGYTFFGDSTYHLSFTFAHAADTLTLEFASSLFEGKGENDESWGLDNVVVSIDQPDNTLSDAERRAGWRLLFDGRTLKGWMWSTDAMPPEPSWAVDDGLLHTTPDRGTQVYLLTRDSFSDFELKFDWKAEPGANSGVKYRFQGYWVDGKAHDKPGGPGRIEPIALEYQITDDEKNPDALHDPRHSTAALYGYQAARKTSPARANVWHTGRIVARGLHIEHWLDGRKVLDLTLDSPEAQVAFRNSTRKGSSPLLAMQERRLSPVALQVHDGMVWFRNLKIHKF